MSVIARMTVTRAAARVEAVAKKNFEGAHKRGEPHVGGASPNVVSGTLRRSITRTQVFRLGETDWGTKVGPATVYARRIELGYPGGGHGPGHQRTRAFPYFKPAVDKVIPEFHDIAAETWNLYLRH
jgi:hypothetical protein